MLSTSQRQNGIKSAENVNFPGSPISLDSTFYIERPPTEALAYAELNKPGSLIRIRSPRKMGKSSLMLRLINYATTLGYHTVTIDFQQADTAIFDDLDKFLRWLCFNMAHQLKKAANLDDYWDKDMGSKVSSSIYLEGYLLAQIDTPLVLVLNEINHLFEHPKIAQDFFSLMRFWYEQARQREIWQKLRLVLVHSTEIYVSLSINQSPFNIGLALKLPEFTSEQVQDLAQRHGLNLSEEQIQQLTHTVGGHPYLVHLALYDLCCYNSTLEELLQAAPTQAGIYGDHLRNLWLTLQQQPQLAAAMEQVLAAESSIQLEPLIAYQLERMGLIKLNGNNCTISYELYRLYFQQQKLGNSKINLVYIEELEKENRQLQSLAYLDPITEIANRRQFEHNLEIQWEKMSRSALPLSLIIGNIDYFKIYNETYGQKAGDYCLWQVAQAISQVVKRPEDLVARYGGNELVIILPGTDAAEATSIAEEVRLTVKKMDLPFEPSKVICLPNSVVTISLGVACTIPDPNNSPQMLLLEANKALDKSKSKGRDRVTLSPI